MARQRSPERLDQLITCAARVFSERGYRRAQMADVAAAMGVAPGTLYLYVESKEALFHLLVQRGLSNGRHPLPPLPIRTPAPGATFALLRRRFGQEARLPALEAALARRRVSAPRRELQAIVRELYALIARNHQGIKLLERSALDWPDLAALFYTDMRRTVLQRLTRYLERRSTQRLLRPIDHPAAAARLINETIAWFAMHRHRDLDSAEISDEVAQATVVEALVNAFAKE